MRADLGSRLDGMVLQLDRLDLAREQTAVEFGIVQRDVNLVLDLSLPLLLAPSRVREVRLLSENRRARLYFVTEIREILDFSMVVFRLFAHTQIVVSKRGIMRIQSCLVLKLLVVIFDF